MTPEQFELFYILKKQDIPFGERFSAAKEIGEEALHRRIEPVDIPMFYPLTVDLWRSLGLSKTDCDDRRLFEIRKKLANVCWRLSIQLPEGQKFFKYFPRVYAYSVEVIFLQILFFQDYPSIFHFSSLSSQNQSLNQWLFADFRLKSH